MSARATSAALSARRRAGRALGWESAQASARSPALPTTTIGEVSALRFARRDGPLLVVAGVCGGAGTTTLAYLIASAAARMSPENVLLADLGGPAAAVSMYAKVESSHSFPALTEHIARGHRPPRQSFATATHGLRVLATRPDFDEPVAEAVAREVLLQARAAHALTVVDAGTLLRGVERVALAAATHVAWVLPASALGVRRAAVLLSRVRGSSTTRPLLVARDAGQASRAATADLADLADLIGAPLVLVPRLPDPMTTVMTDVIDEASVALQSIGLILAR